MNGRRELLVIKIKKVIIQMIDHSDKIPLINYSGYISKKIGLDYNYLSDIFTEVNGNTIQQFIISHKIEKAKELIYYGVLNLTQISKKLHYSSGAHFSNQFKKVTGFTPSSFKKLRQRKPDTQVKLQ